MQTPTLKSVFLCICVALSTSASSLRRAKIAQSQREPTSAGRPYYMAHACERNLLEVTCDHGLVINIVRVTYGRLTLALCAEGGLSTRDWDMQCASSSRRSHGRVAASCDGRSSCLVPVVNRWFGDPCPNTYKYLEVYYACVAGGFNNLAARS